MTAHDLEGLEVREPQHLPRNGVATMEIEFIEVLREEEHRGSMTARQGDTYDCGEAI